MVDRYVLGKSFADIRDAVARIRQVLPADSGAFAQDRTAPRSGRAQSLRRPAELLVRGDALAGGHRLDVPGAYREVFLALGSRGVVSPDIASRLAAASGLRNLIAHRYGVLDWKRIHDLATNGLDDLVRFCDEAEAAAKRA